MLTRSVYWPILRPLLNCLLLGDHMKNRSLSLALALGVFGTLSQPAQAATYCDENTLGRTAVGAGLGAVAGNIIGNGDSGATALGALFGGAVGLGMSCESYPTYYRERNYVLDREIYSNYHEWDNGRIRVVRSGYYGGIMCREYESYIAVEDVYGDIDEVLVTERACRYRDGWRVVNYPVSSFRWANSYAHLSIHYIPSSRYSWGYNRYYGGYHRGRHYGPSHRDFFWGRRHHMNERHRWQHRRYDHGSRHDYGRPRMDRPRYSPPQRMDAPRGSRFDAPIAPSQGSGMQAPRGPGGGDQNRGGSRGQSGNNGPRGDRGPRN